MTFKILGEIVDTCSDKRTPEDVCPQDIKDFIDSLKPNEDITIEITSFGGSCTAGNAIVGLLKKAEKDGHETTAHVMSIAASMASVIACCCKNLVIDSNSFLMIHLPWSHVEGNYINMRKEADTLELFAKSLVAIYRTKFELRDEDIMKMLEAETWILGSDAESYGLKCVVLNVDEELKIAASLNQCKYKMKNIPKGFKMSKENEENVERVEERVEEVVEEKDMETTPEEMEDTEVVEETKKVDAEDNEDAEPSIEELQKKIEELEAKLAEYETEDGKDEDETVTKEECDRRVSGMQAKMQRKINDFVNQLKVRDEELAKAKADAISLKDELDKATKELSKTASALVEKEKTLAMLNAGVNSPCETTDWRNLKGKEFWDFLKKHPEITKTNN